MKKKGNFSILNVFIDKIRVRSGQLVEMSVFCGAILV
jgi:hypothetical protein